MYDLTFFKNLTDDTAKMTKIFAIYFAMRPTCVNFAVEKLDIVGRWIDLAACNHLKKC